MKLLTFIVGGPVVAWFALRDPGFRKIAKECFREHQAHTAKIRRDKLTLLEEIEVNVSALILGTLKAIETVISLYFTRSFWREIIAPIYQRALDQQVELVQERRKL